MESVYNQNYLDKNLKKAFYFFFFFEILLIVIANSYKPFIVYAGIIAIIFFAYSLFSTKKVLVALVIYLSVLPAYSWGEKYDFFKFYASDKIIVLILLLALVYLSIDLTLNRKIYTKEFEFSKLDYLLLMFLGMTIFSAIRGYLYGFRTDFILFEMLPILYYGVYFIFLFHLNSEKAIRQFWWLVIIVTLVASVQYYFLFKSVHSVFNLGLKRVTTQQPHLAQIAVPYLMTYILLPASKKMKILSGLLLFPIMLMVVLSQQRGLWGAILFTIVFAIVLAVVHGPFSRKNKIIFMVIILVVSLSVGALGIVLVHNSMSSGASATLEGRVTTMTNLSEDFSFVARVAEFPIALRQVKNIFIGTGLGTYIHRLAADEISDSLDNAYVYLYWKMGLVGLFLFLSITFLFIKHAYYLCRHAKDLFVKRIAISALSGYTGLMIIALTNTCILRYRFDLIWAIIIASIEIFYRREKNVA